MRPDRLGGKILGRERGGEGDDGAADLAAADEDVASPRLHVKD